MRTLKQIIQGKATNDGDGVHIRRIAGAQLNALLDPFLMLDEINSDDASDYIGGFPEHPHRGMETITYMKAGRMRHRDHMGNEGIIGPGDVQWMTAGKGVLHSEMPEQESGLLHGFQLWLNLPAAEKMKPAAYRDIRASDIPVKTLGESGNVAVISGDVVINDDTLLSGVFPQLTTEPVLLDVSLDSNQRVTLSFNTHYPALVYVIGGGLVGEYSLGKSSMGIFSEGEQLILTSGVLGASLLVLSGKPLKEPIVQYGPFVMNSKEEIDQAINDFRIGQFV